MNSDTGAAASDAWSRLEQAAEITISAAAAAMMWAGADERGVLARVAAANAGDMLISRMVAESLASSGSRRAFTPAEEDSFEATPGYVLAALPAWLAPQWAATVRGAFSDSIRRCEETRHTDQGTAEATRKSALETILQWTESSLPLLRIEMASRVAVSTRAWVPSVG